MKLIDDLSHLAFRIYRMSAVYRREVVTLPLADAVKEKLLIQGYRTVADLAYRTSHELIDGACMWHLPKRSWVPRGGTDDIRGCGCPPRHHLQRHWSDRLQTSNGGDPLFTCRALFCSPSSDDGTAKDAEDFNIVCRVGCVDAGRCTDRTCH